MPLQRLSWALEYAGVRLLEGGFRLLSWDAARRAGEAIGLLAAALVRRRWHLTLDNLRHAFPEESPERLRHLAREAWLNLGRIGAEFVKSAHAPKSEILARCRYENLDLVTKSLRPGRGAIAHLGHFANWELAGLALTAHGIPLAVVGRRIKNPYVDRWVNAVRSRFGALILSHKNPFFPVVRSLKEGRLVGILMDQSLPTGGVFVDFFGRPAATTTLTALLALKLGCPVFKLRLLRRGGEVVARFEGPFEIPSGLTEGEVAARLTADIEAWARERPEDWFWLHNRWKRSGEAARSARPAEARRA